MEVFDFVAESKKFLAKLRELLELQYRYVLDGGVQQADADRKIQQGLDKTTQSIYNWVETVIQDWEQRFTGTVSLFTQNELSNIQPAADDTWTGTSQLLPPSPALTPTVAPSNETSTNAGSRDDSPESTNHVSVNGTAASRRTNPPPKRIRRSDVVAKTQIPVPIQKARTPQPQSRTPSSSLRRPSGVPMLASQPPTSLPPNAPIQNPRPSYPQHWEYPPVSSPYGPPYSIMTSSPGLPPQHHPTAPPQYATGVPQSPFLPSEPTTPAEHQQQPPLDGMQHESANTDPHHSATIRASRFMGATPRSSLNSVWVRDGNANRDSAQTLVDVHPPGPCTNFYCPSCSKTLPDGVGHPGMPHSVTGGQPGMGVGGGFESNGMMVGPGGFPMHVVGEEQAAFTGQGWAPYPVGVDGTAGVHGGGGVMGGGMFGHGGLQEGF